MTTAAKAAKGCVLTWNGTTVAEVLDISGLEITTDFKDVTSHDSPNNFKEKIPTLLEASAFTAKCNFVEGDAGRQAMIADQLSKTSRSAVITPPSGSAWSWTCTAYIQKMTIGGLSKDGEQLWDVTIMPTGKPTLAETASAGLSGLTGIQENAGAALDFIPNFAIGTFVYTVAVNTASTFVKFTPTGASHTITITNDFDSSVSTVVTGNQSGELDLGAAETVTKFTIKAQESGKTVKTYTVYVTRAAA
jgi:hypothetical protein